MSHNKSYADTNVQGDNGLYYSYTSVFKEYTTKEAGIACSSYANCYIGCTCKTGWNKNSASVSNTDSVTSLSNGISTQSADGNTQVVSLDGGVSTMSTGESCTVSVTDPRYGTTCSISSTKDCAGVCDGSAYFYCASGSTSSSCSNGYYSVNVGTQKCSSGSATNSTSCYTCNACSYSCPSGYYTSAGSGYYLTSTSTYQVCNGDSSQTNSTKCYTRAACSYSCPSGYSTGTTSSSCASGYTFKSTSATTQTGCSAQTCGKCEENTYSCDGSAGATNDCYTWHCEFDEAHKSQASACNYDSTYCDIDGGSSWCSPSHAHYADCPFNYPELGSCPEQINGYRRSRSHSTNVTCKYCDTILQCYYCEYIDEQGNYKCSNGTKEDCYE